jgi:hypothetical protein
MEDGIEAKLTESMCCLENTQKDVRPRSIALKAVVGSMLPARCLVAQGCRGMIGYSE